MKINAYFYALFTIFLWSTVAAVAKLLLSSVNSVQLLLYIGVFSTLFLMVIILSTNRIKNLKSLSKKDLLDFALFGFIGLFLYQTFFLKALDIAPAVEVSVLNYLWPIAIILFSIILLKERLTAKTVIALLLGFIGAYFIISKGNITAFRFTNLLGDVLAISAALFWGLFSILSKRKKTDSLTSMFMYNLLALPFILFYAFATNNLIIAPLADIAGAAYIGIFATALAYTSWIKALQIGNTQKIATLSYLTPFLSVLFISIIIKEDILFFQIIGLLLIIFGILIHNLKRWF